MSSDHVDAGAGADQPDAPVLLQPGDGAYAGGAVSHSDFAFAICRRE